MAAQSSLTSRRSIPSHFRADVTFLGLSESDSLAEEPEMNRHTLTLSAFCFLPYFGEASHKSSILNTRDTALSHQEVVVSP